MEQNKEENITKTETNNNDGCLKYILIVISTLIGSFLAFYFVADLSIKIMFSPEYQMRRAEKMMHRMDKHFMRNLEKDFKFADKNYSNPVNIEKTDNNYVVEILLKPFGNTSNNITITSQDDETIKIEAKNESQKGDKQNLTSMTQIYKLDEDFDFSKKTEKETKDKLIITLPIKDK